MPTSPQITLLHGRNDTPSGHVQRLETVLKEAHPTVDFCRPFIPDVDSASALDWFSSQYVKRLEPGSLLVGLDRGGLIACAIQAKFPALQLSVAAINSPTSDGELTASSNRSRRFALYSSAYPLIRNNCFWQAYAVAFDVPWLANGYKNYYPLAYLISAFMGNKDMEKEVALMFPPSIQSSVQ